MPMQITKEFPFPSFVKEATKHDHFFMRKNLAKAGWGNLDLQGNLTAEQEKQLFAAMQVAGCLACKYKGQNTPFTKRGWKYYNLYRQLFAFLLQKNLGLVYVTVARSGIYVANVEDLESEGYMSLFNAVRNFDPWRGFRFSTYACNAIKRSCWKFATQQSKKAGKQLIMAGGEENLSYKEPFDIEDPRNLIDLFMSRTHSLTDREIGVLQDRYLTGRIKTLEEIGVKMGISKERVRQIQDQAIRKIQCVVHPDEY